MRLRRFAFLGLFVSSVLAQQKIHPDLEQIADPDSRLRVLIMLRDQPQREVAARVSEAASAYIDSTDTEYRRLTNEPFAFLPSLEAARTRRDLAVIETRREILRQIDSLIGPAQRNLIARLIFHARAADLSDDVTSRHFVVTALTEELIVEHDGVIPPELEDAFAYLSEQNVVLARRAARGVMSAFAGDFAGNRTMPVLPPEDEDWPLALPAA